MINVCSTLMHRRVYQRVQSAFVVNWNILSDATWGRPATQLIGCEADPHVTCQSGSGPSECPFPLFCTILPPPELELCSVILSVFGEQKWSVSLPEMRVCLLITASAPFVRCGSIRAVYNGMDPCQICLMMPASKKWCPASVNESGSVSPHQRPVSGLAFTHWLTCRIARFCQTSAGIMKTAGTFWAFAAQVYVTFPRLTPQQRGSCSEKWWCQIFAPISPNVKVL